MEPGVLILEPGFGVTVQDLGRTGSRHLGVPPSGALDEYAHRVANWLVGNAATCATLEIPLGGVRLRCLAGVAIAVTGARLPLRHNGKPVRQWMAVVLRPGDELELGLAENGCRGYLAVTGGIAVPTVLGSRSTYLGGRLGGLSGRALVAGDVLPVGRELESGQVPESLPALPWVPVYPELHTLRAIPGPHADFFQHRLDDLFAAEYTISPQSNRMGVRLTGPAVLRDDGAPTGLLSEPVVAGNIQIPADGQPIVLLREQTMGGYTAIATVIGADLWRIGQMQPGQRVRFIRVSLEEGQRFGRQWQTFLSQTEQLLARNQPLAPCTA